MHPSLWTRKYAGLCHGPIALFPFHFWRIGCGIRNINWECLETVCRYGYATQNRNYRFTLPPAKISIQRANQIINILFLAIATHKFVITFCIGLELVGGNNQRAISTCAYIIYMVTFILVSPFGKLLMLLSNYFCNLRLNSFVSYTRLNHLFIVFRYCNRNWY